MELIVLVGIGVGIWILVWIGSRLGKASKYDALKPRPGRLVPPLSSAVGRKNQFDIACNVD